MKNRKRKLRISFFAKLLIMYLFIGIIMIFIFISGNKTVRLTSTMLNMAFSQQARPLAQVIRFQSWANKIRILEAELPKLTDYFAVIGAVGDLKKESEEFGKELNDFISVFFREGDERASRLTKGWNLYQKNLERSMKLALEMNMDEVSNISTYMSRPRFRIFSKHLENISSYAESIASQKYTRAVSKLESKRKAFLWMSVAGILLGVIFAFFLSRSLSSRVNILIKGAIRLAEGDTGYSMQIKGNDEIGDLAASFNHMQEKMQTREQALQKAHNELEQRVDERTAELKKINKELQAEITERKRAEEELRNSEEKSRAILRAIPDVIFRFREDGVFLSFEGASENLYVEPEEFLGRKPHDILPPEIAELTVLSIENALDSGELQVYEYQLPIKGEPRHFESRMVPNKKNETLCIIRDITMHKRAEIEKEKLQTQLQHALRMESIGTLAGGVAHNFNNLLMSILGNASLLLMTIEPEHPHYEKLKKIEEYVQKGAELTNQITGFARGGKYEVRPANLNNIVRKSSEMFGHTRKEINICTEYQKNVWTVEADHGQIEQALLNLYVNAWQAMPRGGDLYIQTENVILTDFYVKPYEAAPGKYVKVSVSDTGEGMDKVIIHRIFDPFFTTRDSGKGTGLGLASVYGIIKNHRGIINVYSEPDEGTIFNIFIPASDQSAVKNKKLLDDVLKGDETLLLVDDEERIVSVGVQILEKLGYTALIARSGKEALEIYSKEQDRIDLIVLDMVMPEMGGGECYDRLKQINPDVKIVLSSGYSVKSQAKEIMDKGCDGFIQKPFSIIALSHKLRDILDS
ncbi:MAG: response regulator [Desulfobacteraceae bacterium]|nr:response regulator [Desulfobacteraceae bacterium]